MKKLLLISIATLFLTIGPRPAKTEQVSQDRYNCMIARAQALGRVGDARYSRLVHEVTRRGGYDSSKRIVAAGSLRSTADARSLKREVSRYCR